MADRSVVYRLRADVTQFKAQMASAAASVKAAGDKMTAADKGGQEFRKGLSTLGLTAGRVGLVAAAGLGVAVLKAANFDQAMSNVSAATHESAASMEQLRSAALKAGADTVFSATEAASGIENLAKAGVSTADILAGGLTGALDLAAAGNQSVGDAAETAATAMTQFGLAGKDIPHIADLLAAGAGKAQGEVSDLAAALKQGGLVAASMGLSIEDTTGTLAAFASAGLVGSDAGTSFKSMIQRLQNPLGQGAKAMERLGINAYDAQGNFVGITSVAGQLQDKLGGLTQAQRDAAMAQIFGSDAVRAANVLYTQGASGIQGWIDKTNDSGYAAETAAIKLDNLKGDLEALSGSLETALIGTGSGSQGPLRSLVQSLTDVTNAYNDLPQGAKSAAAATLGFVAVAGGGLFVFSKLVSGVASTRLAMSQLGLTTGRSAAALSAVGKAAGVAAAGLAGLAIIDALQVGFGKASIGTEAMTKSLLGLKGASSTSELDGIADSIDRLANPNSAQALQDNVAGVLGFGGGSELRDAKAQIEALDAALTNLATSAGPETATAAFGSLTESALLSKSQIGDLKSLLPGYQEALTGAANGATMAAGATDEFGAAAGGLGGGLTDAELAAEKFTATLDSLNAVLSGRAGLRDYQASLDDFTASLKENGRSFDINTAKGRANQAALDNIASSALKVADGLKGAARQKFLTTAIGDIRALGRQMDLPQSQVRALIRLLRQADAADASPKVEEHGATPSQKRIKAMRDEIAKLKDKRVKADQKGAETATAKIRALRAAIAALRDRTVTITERRRYSGNSGIGGAEQNADGGTIEGQRQPYGDKVLTYLAPGEEVVSNRYGQADRHRALLKAINAGRMADGGTVQHLANGGTARRGGGGNTAALRHELERLRVAAAGSATAITRETATREALASKRSELASTVKDKFTSELFGDSNVWQAGGGAGGAFGILKADIAKAKTFKSLLYGLSKRGLDGDALAELASTGDVGKAQAFSSMSTKDLGTYESLYRQRATAASAVGSYAGMAAFSFEQQAANKHLTVLVAVQKAQTVRLHAIEKAIGRSAHNTGRAINTAASAGQRRRNR